MPLTQLTEEQQAQLRGFMTEGKQALQQMDTMKDQMKDIRAGLKETTKHFATLFDCDEKTLSQALKMAYEDSYREFAEYADDVQFLLERSGQINE